MEQVTTVKERPILFSGPMVRAILEGRKTQTRRVITPQPPAHIQKEDDGHYWNPACHDGGCYSWYVWRSDGYRYPDPSSHRKCPYGQYGDRLWVRETFVLNDDIDDEAVGVTYRADMPEVEEYADIPWRPSIHMRRWASRITLEVTGVWVERIQDIFEADAKAEGAPDEIPFDEKLKTPYRHGFYNLWNAINGKRGFGWDANPWVWVIEFKRISK